jgi:four helix bundle protein
MIPLPRKLNRAIAERVAQQMGTSFRELVVWQRAIEMSLAIYKLTTSFPNSERFGLTDQLRRAAVSVGSNISEGYGRASRGEYVQFLGHARGSIFEVQTQLTIAQGLGYGTAESLAAADALASEVGRMLNSMMTKLRPSRGASVPKP